MDTGIDYDSPDLYQNIWINQAEIPNFWYTKSSSTSGYDKIVYKSEIKTATPGVITFADLNNAANKGLVWDNNSDGRIDAGDLLGSVNQGGWMSGSTKDGDTAHPDDLFGWNFVSNTNNPFDDNGHGTNVSGILGATGNNGTGVAGVDWNVQIMPIKFIGSNGEGTVSDFIEGLNYSVQHGAKITNNSWEGRPTVRLSTTPSKTRSNTAKSSWRRPATRGPTTMRPPTIPPVSAGASTMSSRWRPRTTPIIWPRSRTMEPRAWPWPLPASISLAPCPAASYGAMSGTSMATPEVTGSAGAGLGIASELELHPGHRSGAQHHGQAAEPARQGDDRRPTRPRRRRRLDPVHAHHADCHQRRRAGRRRPGL